MKRSIAIILAVIVAVQVVRNALVVSDAATDPSAASRVWPGHPDVEISRSMVEIAQAARAKRDVEQDIFASIDDAATKAPLAPEPFLVHGTAAQIKGDTEQAERNFQAAQWRNPRSFAAAYFLADHYVKSKDDHDGLKQIALISRLVPSGGVLMAPYLASYARNPSVWPKIRSIFKSDRGLENAVLLALAQDPRNSGVVMALASADNRQPDSGWLPVMLNKLLETGSYAQARKIWASVSRPSGGGGGLLYDSNFKDEQAPPPFNWKLQSSTLGLADRERGRLRVLFYGSQDGLIASQLLLLQPGSYTLQMQLAGTATHPELLSWAIRCDKSPEAFASIGIQDAGSRGWKFTVPQACPAQWIELSGRSGDIAEQAEVVISRLSLIRTASHAQ